MDIEQDLRFQTEASYEPKLCLAEVLWTQLPSSRMAIDKTGKAMENARLMGREVLWTQLPSSRMTIDKTGKAGKCPSNGSRRSLDTVAKFKNVIRDKTGKAMENARLFENLNLRNSNQVQECGHRLDREGNEKCPSYGEDLWIQSPSSKNLWMQLLSSRMWPEMRQERQWKMLVLSIYEDLFQAELLDVDLNVGQIFQGLMSVEGKDVTAVFFWLGSIPYR
ncbi:hypothetical protein ACROYT_G031670 [Oculina patagonica]